MIGAATPLFPGARIGLYGGSFDPPHAGHRHVAHTALRCFGLGAVWVLVSPQNPLKPDRAAPYAQRLAAARALLAGPRIVVTDLEARIGARYTVETLAWLRAHHPGISFVLVMGADSFAGLHRWRDWRALARMASIGVVPRPGWSLRAQLSPAARILPRRASFSLAGTTPPGWSYAFAPFHAESSTSIRRAGKIDWPS